MLLILLISLILIFLPFSADISAIVSLLRSCSTSIESPWQLQYAGGVCYKIKIYTCEKIT